MKTYRGLIYIIVAFFVLSIVIGQCSTEDDSFINGDMTIVLPSETIVVQPISQSKSSNNLPLTKRKLDLASVHDTLYVEKLHNEEGIALEIPKIIDVVHE